MPDTTIELTVRYFAAARAAAGADGEIVTLTSDATVADLLATLRTRGEKLARVLDRCSFLCDGIATRDVGQRLQTTQIVDVLPPFAGG